MNRSNGDGAEPGPVQGWPAVPPGASSEVDIRRDAEGRWYHEGVLVEHEGVARSFDAWVDRHENGRYVLRNEVNWAFVEIEGPPMFVRRVQVQPEALQLELSGGLVEALKPETLRRDREGRLYCQVRGGRLTAAFGRQAMFDLSPVLEGDEQAVRVRVGTTAFEPSVTDDPIR